MIIVNGVCSFVPGCDAQPIFFFCVHGAAWNPNVGPEGSHGVFKHANTNFLDILSNSHVV